MNLKSYVLLINVTGVRKTLNKIDIIVNFKSILSSFNK